MLRRKPVVAATLTCGSARLPRPRPRTLEKNLLGRHAAQAVALPYARHILSLKNAFHRHQAYGLPGLAIMATSVPFHDQLAFSNWH